MINVIETALLCLYILIIVTVIRYFWVLMKEVKKSNRYQEAQIRLLAEIAVKSEVSINIVSKILSDAEIN